MGEELEPDVPVGKVCSRNVGGVSGVLLDDCGRLCMDVVESLLGDLSVLPWQKKENGLSNILWPLTVFSHFGTVLQIAALCDEMPLVFQ